MGKIALILFVLIAGCTTTHEPLVKNPRQIWCDNNEPRRDATAATPRPVLNQINTHNRRGALWCGWKP